MTPIEAAFLQANNIRDMLPVRDAFLQSELYVVMKPKSAGGRPEYLATPSPSGTLCVTVAEKREFLEHIEGVELVPIKATRLLWTLPAKLGIVVIYATGGNYLNEDNLWWFRTSCDCQSKHTGFTGESRGELDVLDPDVDQAWFIECQTCGAVWLRMLFEAPHYSKSGHWYDALLTEIFDPLTFPRDKAAVDGFFAKSPRVYRGGSFFDGKVEPYTGIPKRLV